MLRLLFLLLLPLLFYPVYFIAVNVVDSIAGDQQLINWLLFDSRHILFFTFLEDWLHSLPVMYGLFFLVIKPVMLLSEKILKVATLAVIMIVGVIVFAVSGALGFGGVGIFVNVFATLLILTLVYISEFIYRVYVK